MAKSSSEFTENSIGKGKSTGISDKNIGFGGQHIKTAYPMDNIHGLDLPNTRGGSFRGGPTNLKHSLTGATAVQDGPGAAGKVKNILGD